MEVSRTIASIVSAKDFQVVPKYACVRLDVSVVIMRIHAYTLRITQYQGQENLGGKAGKTVEILAGAGPASRTCPEE
jgi:hypothetical protein